MTDEIFLNFFEDGYCGIAYDVSNFNELKTVKQRGSLQEYIAMHTQLQAYNEITPIPVTDGVLKESFISGVQNYARQRYLKTITSSRAEIANEEEVPEVTREAERLVRDGVFSEYGDARMTVQMHQDPGSASMEDLQGIWNRSSAIPGFCPNHKPHSDQ